MRRASRQGEATPHPQTPDRGRNAPPRLTNANSHPRPQSHRGDDDVTRHCSGVTVGGNAIPRLRNAITTHRNAVTTRRNDVATHGNVVAMRGNVIATRRNVVATHGNDVSTHGNDVTTRGNVVSMAGNGISMPENDVSTGGNLDFRVGMTIFDERNARLG